MTPARGQDKSDVNSASERYLSPVRALGRSEIAGHNAGSFLLWDIPTYSEIKAVYDLRREDDALLPQEGDGLDQGSVKVYSLIRLQNHSAVRAGAEYSRGVKRNVLWNSTSDFELLYPDVMVDTIGGNLQKEQYSFYGAWSRLIGKAHIGVYGGYRALHEFRQVDPRPRSVTSDLNAALTGGIAAKGYVFDLTPRSGFTNSRRMSVSMIRLGRTPRNCISQVWEAISPDSTVRETLPQAGTMATVGKSPRRSRRAIPTVGPDCCPTTAWASNVCWSPTMKCRSRICGFRKWKVSSVTNGSAAP